MNGQHLLVQLMESYKILSTALERGLLGTKQGIEFNNLVYPNPVEGRGGGGGGGGGGVGVGGGCEGDEGMSSGEGGEISVEIIQLINTLGNIRIREAGVSSSSSAHHNTSSGGKKKKKKKRGNKPMVVDTGLTVDPATVPVSAVDTETVVMSTSSADNDHNIARKVGPQKGGVVNDGCRTIKDIVRQEQMSKPLRVHEYYKLWGIYELDVVY